MFGYITWSMILNATLFFGLALLIKLSTCFCFILAKHWIMFKKKEQIFFVLFWFNQIKSCLTIDIYDTWSVPNSKFMSISKKKRIQIIFPTYWMNWWSSKNHLSAGKLADFDHLPICFEPLFFSWTFLFFKLD